ncbi:MAG: PAS domain S-box protein [Deltaproteobacteria bacterium]|nr:PAS domain S-box protein [Deltaproteobacteria bacterium]
MSEAARPGASWAEEVSDLLAGLDAVVWAAEPRTLRVSSVAGHVAELGYTPEAWRGENFWNDALHPDERAHVLSSWRNAARDGVERSGVHRMRTADGGERWVRTRVRAIREDDGRIRRLVGLSVDITQQRRGEDTLHDLDPSELVLAQLPAAVYTTDRQLRLTAGAGAALASLGTSAQQLPGVTLAEFLHTDDPENPEIVRHRRALAGESLSFDTAWLGRRLQVHLQPLRDATGEIIGVLGVTQDVTDLRRVEAAHAESNERFRQLAEASFEGIVLHAQGRILLSNRAFATMFGYGDPSIVVGKSILDFTHRDSREEVVRHVQVRSEEPYEIKALRQDGSWFHAELRSKNARYGDRMVRVTAIRDITARKLADQERERLLKEANEARARIEQLAEDATRRASDLAEFDRLKDQFIRVAAHELKTPVTVMKGHAQRLLRARAELPSPRRGALEAIVRGSDRIDRVTQELVDVSQLSLGTLAIAAEPVDLAALVRTVVGHVRSDPRHRVRVTGDRQAKVRGDAYRLQYVVGNLLDNAIRYSPDGGDIDVKIAVHGGAATISVTDHGVGIPKDRQARIFERFYRAHTDTPHDAGGIGVALAICRDILARHGGSIDFESTEGEGSTFSFRIPLEAAHADLHP